MKIGIIGASGYTGVELLRLLASRPDTEVVLVTSRKEAGLPLTKLFPFLAGLSVYDRLIFQSPEDLSGPDIFFLATPHGTAMDLVPGLLAKGARVIDLSADFRLNSAEVFEKWYQPHKAPELLGEAVYGLPELYRKEISSCRLLANPGCYPTSIILALAPLMKNGLVDLEVPLIADSKSGVTGAGREASLGNSFCEVADNFKAYKPVGHRHTPEINEQLSLACGKQVSISFTPHLLPVNRGILSTVYVRLKTRSYVQVEETFREFYASAPFVRIRPEGYCPQTADVRGTNFCDLGFYWDEANGLWKIISVIDNLCRGASGQAVANLNIMTGVPETQGLDSFAFRP